MSAGPSSSQQYAQHWRHVAGTERVRVDRAGSALDCAAGQGFDLVETPDGPAVRFTGACTLQPDDVWDIRYLADG